MLTAGSRRSHCVPDGPAARGFTLVELVVTLTLLGLLLALGLPSFTTWIANSQVRTVAESLQDGIRVTQAEAVRRNRQVVLSFTNATPALNAAAAAGGKNWSVQTVARLDEAAEFIRGGLMADVASSVAITGNPASSAICFNSSGRLATNASATGVPGAACAAAATAFTVDKTNSDRPLRVNVAVGGQVRMCDPNRPALSTTSPDGC